MAFDQSRKDVKVRPGGGHAKGAQFEREVCVLLSKWISNGDREDLYWRSSMSGGRATIAGRKGKKLSAQAGDISCIDPMGHRFIEKFVPECKRYADLNYSGLLTGKGKLLDFWAELNWQASEHNKRPFLVARQNRMPTYVCLDWLGMEELALSEQATTLISIPNNMYLIEINDFFKWCKPYIDKPRRTRIKLNAKRGI